MRFSLLLIPLSQIPQIPLYLYPVWRLPFFLFFHLKPFTLHTCVREKHFCILFLRLHKEHLLSISIDTNFGPFIEMQYLLHQQFTMRSLKMYQAFAGVSSASPIPYCWHS